MHPAAPPDRLISMGFSEALKLQVDRVIPKARAWLGDFAVGSKIQQQNLRCNFSIKELLIRRARQLQENLAAEIERDYNGPPSTKSLLDSGRAEDLAFWREEIENMRRITRVPHVTSLKKWQLAVARAMANAIFPRAWVYSSTTESASDLYGLLQRGCTHGLPGARAELLSHVDRVRAWELRSEREQHADVGKTLGDWLSHPKKDTPPLAQMPSELGDGRKGATNPDTVRMRMEVALRLVLADLRLVDVYADDDGSRARLFNDGEVDNIVQAVMDDIGWLQGKRPNGDGSWWDDYLRWIEGFWDGTSQYMRPGPLRCAIANANSEQAPKQGQEMDPFFGFPRILHAAHVGFMRASHDEIGAADESVEDDAERRVRGEMLAKSKRTLLSQRQRTDDLVATAQEDFDSDLITAAYCNALHVQLASDEEGLPRGDALEGKTVLREVDTDSKFFQHVKSLFAQSDPRLLGQGNDARNYASKLAESPTQPEKLTVPSNSVPDLPFDKMPYGQIVPIKVFEVDMEHRKWRLNPALDAPSSTQTPTPDPHTTDFKAGYDAARAIVEDDLLSHMSMWYRKRKFPLAPRSELNPRGVAPADPSERVGDSKHWKDPYFVDPSKLQGDAVGKFTQSAGAGADPRVNDELLQQALVLDREWWSPQRMQMVPDDEKRYYQVYRSQFPDGGNYGKYGLEYAAVRATVALRTKEERKQQSEWPDDGGVPPLGLDMDNVGVHSAVHHTRLGRWWKEGLKDKKLTWTHKAMARKSEPENAPVDYAQPREAGGLLHGGPMRYDEHYDEPDEFDKPQLNETMLLHGTGSRLVPHILAGGFDSFQKTVEGTYFGSGIYFAEDPAKADQYGRLAGESDTTALAFDRALQKFFGIEDEALNDAVEPADEGSAEKHVFYMVMARATTGLAAMTSHYNFTSQNRLGTFMAPEHAYREFVAAEITHPELVGLGTTSIPRADGSTSTVLMPVSEDGIEMLNDVWKRYWNDNYQGGGLYTQGQHVHGEKRNFVERNELLFEEVWQYLEFMRSNKTHGTYGFRPPSRLFRVARWDDAPDVKRRFYRQPEGVPRVTTGLGGKLDRREELSNKELAIRNYYSVPLPYLAVATSQMHQTAGSNMHRQEQIHRQYHCLQANGYGGRTMRGTGQRWEHLIRFRGSKGANNDTYFGGQMRFREFVMFQNRRNTPAAAIPQFLVAYKRLPRPVMEPFAEGPKALVNYVDDPLGGAALVIKNDSYTRDSAARQSALISWETPVVYSLDDPYCPCETWDSSRWRNSLHDYPTIYQQMPYVMGRRTRVDAYTPPLIFDYYGDWLRVLNSVPVSAEERTNTNANTPGVMEQLQVSDRLYNPAERGPYHPSGGLKRAGDEDAVMAEPQVARFDDPEI